MGQDLANEPVLEVLPVMHPDTRYGKVLGQLETNRFDDFAPACTRAHQAGWLGERHTRPWRGAEVNPLALRQHGVLILVNEALVRGDDATRIPVYQGRKPLDVVGAGCQQRVMRDVTVGIASQEYLEAMLAEPFAGFTFSPAGASVYQFGNFGTAQKKLKAWELKP